LFATPYIADQSKIAAAGFLNLGTLVGLIVREAVARLKPSHEQEPIKADQNVTERHWLNRLSSPANSTM